jgi:hypothetical protein
MQAEELLAIVFSLVILSGVFIVVMGLRQRSLQLEMRHKERMAMIERGLTPTREALSLPPADGRASAAASRWMTLGIVIVAVGMGLATVISVAGESPEVGLGIGGGIAIVGAAFIANSLLARGQAQHQRLSPPDEHL